MLASCDATVYRSIVDSLQQQQPLLPDVMTKLLEAELKEARKLVIYI